MMMLSLAWRNLLRNRRRSITTMVAMVIGMIAILLFGGYRQSISYGLQSSYVQRGGHLQIQHRDYFVYGSGNPVAYGISEYDTLIKAIKTDPILAPMVRMVTPVLQVNGIAANVTKGVSRTAVAVGVNAEDQNVMRSWNEYGTSAAPKQIGLTGSSENAVVIGAGLARTLQLCGPLRVADCVEATPTPSAEENVKAAPDDIVGLAAGENRALKNSPATQIELLVANPNGAPNIAALDAIKAEDMGAKEVDDIFVSMHLSQAQRLVYGSAKHRVTAVQIQLKSSADLLAAQAHIEKMLKEKPEYISLKVLDFRALNPSFGQINAMFGAVFASVSILILIIVLFTVSNTMSMVVMERTPEIGTLRAIGQRRSGIRNMFLAEGVLMGAASAALGVAFALAIAFAINHSGLSWTPPGRVEAVRIAVRVWGESTLLNWSVIGLIVVSALSAWLPARRGANLNIVDALRHS